MRSVTLEGRGHLVPMEVPAECAELAGGWIGEEVRRWKAGEGADFGEWRARAADEKQKMGPSWYKFLQREKAKI